MGPLGKRKQYFALALCALLVLGFIASSTISYFVAHNSLSEQVASEALPLTSDNIYSEIERDLLRSILISSLMAHDTFVREWALSNEADPSEIERYLAEIEAKYDTTTAFFVSEATRNYYHSSGVLKTVDRDDPADAWFFRVREMNDDYEINVDTDTADRSRLNIFVNYRVQDFAGEFIGATGIGLEVDTVAERIRSYERRYGRTIYLTDRDGNLMLHSGELSGADNIQEREGMQRVATDILSSSATETTTTGPDGKTWYVNSRLIPELDWHLIIKQEGLAAETRILNALLINVGVALGLCALVGVGGWFTVRGYHVQLEAMATTDELTRCANRHAFAAVFDQVTRAAQRRGEPVALISLDADNFKPINDRFGHAHGDSALRTLADTIRRHVRSADTLFRWGGDEFLLLLSGCKHTDATALAEKIRREVAAQPPLVAGDGMEVTLSIGVAEWQPGESADALVARCDAALYRAKRAGGDQVQVADD